VKAVPKNQWLYNEILSTNLGGFFFETIFTGVILAFGYYIYIDRRTKFRFDPIRCYSIALAYMGLMLLAVSLFTATKTKLWEYLINVPVDRAVKFHKFASASAMLFLLVHSLLEIWFWGPDLMINLDYTLVVGVAQPLAGLLAMCCLMLVSVSSIPWFRNR
jgi:predicted ferric reductase